MYSTLLSANIVMEEYDNFYKIGMKNGMKPQLYLRNQIAQCSSTFLTKEEVPQETMRRRNH